MIRGAHHRKLSRISICLLYMNAPHLNESANKSQLIEVHHLVGSFVYSVIQIKLFEFLHSLLYVYLL